MFENVPLAAPDPILGLTEEFRRDPTPHKINLGAGVYKDPEGLTPVLAAVKEAEQRILQRETTKDYLAIEGNPAYARRVEALVLGEGHEILTSGRAATAHTPGGTGALRVFGDYLKDHHAGARIWLSDPTWVNHPHIFGEVGLPLATYPYYDPASRGLAFDRMMASLGSTAPGDVVVLHGVCHNPSGVDLEPEHWRAVAELLARRGALPVVDLAYLGFAAEVEEDAAGIRILARAVPELVVCTSFSKTLGLYRERVGALTVVCPTAEVARAVLSQLKWSIRALYSSPPSHGGAVASEVLGDPDLRRLWREELSRMRQRIAAMRLRLAAELDSRGLSLAPDGNGFIVRQRGMFSFTGMSREQVAALREHHAIYMVGSGRINVAGLTEANIGRFCDAIAEVLSTPASTG